MKVLIADDTEIGRNTLVSYIGKNNNYEILIAKNGEEARDIWLSEFPRLVVTDWNMPNFSGLDLVEFIRRNEGDFYTYIIMVTGREEESDIVKGFNAGLDDYIKKPLNKNELLMRINVGKRIVSLQDKDMVIFALAKLSETRDKETGFHLERIQNYCKLMAEKLLENKYPGINRQFIESLVAASPLHDIGKVGIPDSILLKPDLLTADEFKIMETHTLLGYETIDKVYRKSLKGDYLKMASEIARSHHERWDGKGYPDKLKGYSIPLSARILSLADYYDALVSKRVYKEAYPHNTVKDMIISESGLRFEPALVETFIELEDKFNIISENFKY